MIATASELRKKFWYRRVGYCAAYTHMNYPHAIRTAFYRFVCRLERQGKISEELARKASL